MFAITGADDVFLPIFDNRNRKPRVDVEINPFIGLIGKFFFFFFNAFFLHSSSRHPKISRSGLRIDSLLVKQLRIYRAIFLSIRTLKTVIGKKAFFFVFINKTILYYTQV